MIDLLSKIHLPKNVKVEKTEIIAILNNLYIVNNEIKSYFDSFFISFFFFVEKNCSLELEFKSKKLVYGFFFEIFLDLIVNIILKHFRKVIL